MSTAVAPCVHAPRRHAWLRRLLAAPLVALCGFVSGAGAADLDDLIDGPPTVREVAGGFTFTEATDASPRRWSRTARPSTGSRRIDRR